MTQGLGKATKQIDSAKLQFRVRVYIIPHSTGIKTTIIQLLHLCLSGNQL